MKHTCFKNIEPLNKKVIAALAASYFFCSNISFATTTSQITNDGPAPKWSLPFQGQIGINTSPVNKLNLAGTSINGKTNATTNNGLDLFKPKKYETLALSQPESLDNILVANNSGSQTATINNGKFISGEISVWDGPIDIDHVVDHLLDKHFEISPEAQKLNEQVKRLASIKQKTIDLTKDGLNQAFGYQGFDPSARAGKLILDSKDYKVRDVAWAEYERQRYIDKIHAQIVTAMMQIAEGIGNNESERGAQSIAASKEELGALIGADEAERAVRAMTKWLNSQNISYGKFTEKPWGTIERNKKLEQVIKVAFERDPVITAATTKVDKYAHTRFWRRASSRILFVALDGTILFAPGLGPALGAEAIEVGYLLGTGGTEQHKLERELLLDKRIQSRLKVLTQEASMAVDNYRYALVTKNPPLMVFSEAVLNNLTAKTDSTNIVSAKPKNSTFVPELKESEQNRNGI